MPLNHLKVDLFGIETSMVSGIPHDLRTPPIHLQPLWFLGKSPMATGPGPSARALATALFVACGETFRVSPCDA